MDIDAAHERHGLEGHTSVSYVMKNGTVVSVLLPSPCSWGFHSDIVSFEILSFGWEYSLWACR